MKKRKNNYFHKFNKFVLAIYVSIFCLIPGFTVPVHAEDVTLYWDGIYFAADSSVVLEDGSDTSLWNSATRYKFSVRPTHSSVGIFVDGHANRVPYLYYYWYLGTSTTSDLTTYQTYFNDTLKPALSNSIIETVSGSSNLINTTSFNTNNLSLREAQYEGHYFYFVYNQTVLNYPIRAGHISLAYTSSNVNNAFLLALNVMDRNTGSYVSSADFFDEVDNAAYSKSTLTSWFGSSEHPNDYFSTKIEHLMSGGVILPSGGTVTNPDPDPEPSADPSADPSDPSNPSDPSGGSSYSSSSQQQQQQQQIAEGAVQNQQSIESGAVQNTIQSGAVQITNNTGGGITSGLDQAAAGGFFDNVQSGFNGLKSVVQSLGQMPEAVGGFLSFLPDELLNAFYLCFSLIIPLILIKLVI